MQGRFGGGGMGNRGPGGNGQGGGMRFGGRRRGGNGTQESQTPPPPRLDMIDARFRSVYLPQARNETPRSLAVFDGADNNAIVGNRATSDTADQALYVLNNPFVLARADAFATRLNAEAKTQSAKIKRAFLLAYGRNPTTTEHRAAVAFLKDVGSRNGLQLLCQSLLASAEFRYVY